MTLPEKVQILSANCMEDKPHIESIGFIIKKEKLATMASESKYPELVLEDLDPFPGFYDQFSMPLHGNEQKPRSIFFILKLSDFCRDDEYIRKTMHLKRAHNIKFDAVLAISHCLINQLPVSVYLWTTTIKYGNSSINTKKQGWCSRPLRR